MTVSTSDTEPTVNGNRQPSTQRTAAATETVKRRRAQRLVSDLCPRVTLLDDDWLTALAGVVLAECDHRGLPVPEPDEIPVAADRPDRA